MRKLPVGIQSFPYIREEGYLYVDKTEFLYDLINKGKMYFLSCPRRFGKSLLLSALRKMYDGYHFHQRSSGVYNPFSVLSAFSKKNLGRIGSRLAHRHF